MCSNGRINFDCISYIVADEVLRANRKSSEEPP